jgi:hypothetical protein
MGGKIYHAQGSGFVGLAFNEMNKAATEPTGLRRNLPVFGEAGTQRQGVGE